MDTPKGMALNRISVRFVKFKISAKFALKRINLQILGPWIPILLIFVTLHETVVSAKFASFFSFSKPI